MTDVHQELMLKLGFRFGINGPHAARTMMLDELRILLGNVDRLATPAEYASAVLNDNVLGKPTKKSRELTLRHMVALYGLDLANPIFRALRHLWECNERAQPILALAVALARDPLLRSTQSYILERVVGESVRRESTEAFLDDLYPNRFSPASLRSFAQNIAGTWTSAGLLSGRAKKTRSIASPDPESVVILLFLGYLQGRTGQRLFTSDWISLVNATSIELEEMASIASHQGLLVFMNAGGVKEVRFPGYLTPEEEIIRQEAAHVI